MMAVLEQPAPGIRRRGLLKPDLSLGSDRLIDKARPSRHIFDSKLSHWLEHAIHWRIGRAWPLSTDRASCLACGDLSRSSPLPNSLSMRGPRSKFPAPASG